MSTRRMAPRVLQKLKDLIRGQGDRNASRVKRRRVFATKIWKALPILKIVLLVVGYTWILVIPSPELGQRTYIDENALQPGQVNTYWDWADVHRADIYLLQLEALRDRNASSLEFASYVDQEFRKLGLPSSTQNYTFTTHSGVSTGTNAYSILSSPRSSGTEAMLISASRISWTGEGDGALNLRGISTVLSLAAFFKGYSLWAKDLIFVISDGYLDGMQAWITTYHGVDQTNLDAQPLSLSSGVIWTALNIDYPGHSFSHLGVFFEGLNGRLPNQDLYNSFQVISRHTGGVPVILHDHLDPREFPPRENTDLPQWARTLFKDNDYMKEYAYRARNILRTVGYQARGRTSGVHGLLHRFRIDAITLFALPAPGPHGFHAIGRVIESTMRTTNNLLERLHASFFFYLLVGVTTFLKIGSFLPSAVVISTAMMFGGLGLWVDSYWLLQTSSNLKAEKSTQSEVWVTRRRPVLKALGIMIATHVFGVGLFYVRTSAIVASQAKILSPIIFGSISLIPLTALKIPKSSSDGVAPLWMVLKSMNLCFASTVISIISVLNFSLAASLAVILAIPLSYSSPRRSRARLAVYASYVCLGAGWLIFGSEETRLAVWNWEMLGVWFAPLICAVYTPLVLQAAIVCLLPL